MCFTGQESTDAVVENNVAPSLELSDTLTSAEKQALPRETKFFCRGKKLLATEVSSKSVFQLKMFFLVLLTVFLDRQSMISSKKEVH